MNRKALVLWVVVLVAAAQGAAVFAQSVGSSTTDKYLISARAGGINYIEGSVAVARADGSGGRLIRGDRLEIGDRVSAAAGARAEVLLNPGSYLRLGSGSEFEFVTTDLDDLQLKVTKGSAIFEVFATEDFRVTLITPAGRLYLIDSGVYRVDLRPDGVTSVAVTEGKAQLGDSTATIVKSGRVGTIGTSIAIAKFDKGKRDEMDEWSRSRAKDLAKVTASLKQKDIRASLINSFNSNRWGMYDSFGLWIFNARFGGYSFLPFGNRWYSPYGYGFGWGMDWGSIPWWNRYPSTGGIPRGTNVSPPKERRRGAIDPPPFTAVEKQTHRQVRSGSSDTAWPGQRTGGSRSVDPGFSSPASAPMQQSEAPVRTSSRKTSPID